MTAPPQVLLLAAGKSTRIHPVSQGRPKPLLEIGGEAIIARNLRWLASEGVRDVVVNLHYRPQAIRDFVGDGRRFGLDVSYSYEPVILGTAGAAKALAHHWAGRFVVVYGDNLLSTDLKQLMSEHLGTGAIATIAVFDRSRHPHTGIAGGRVHVADRGTIVEFAEGAGDEISPLVNAGVYILEPEVLDYVPAGSFSDFGKDVFPAMLRAGRRLHAAQITAYCLGLDTPESFERAGQLIDTGKVQLR
jgi:mannose-1-phosphate guanylyltransferase